MNKLVLIAGLSLASFTFKTYANIREIVDHLEIGIKNIRDARIKSSQISITFDAVLKNKTDKKFTFNAGNLLSVTGVKIYDTRRAPLGQSELDKNGISFEPFSDTVVSDITVTVKTWNAINLLFNEGLSTNPNDYKIEIQINHKWWVGNV